MEFDSYVLAAATADLDEEPAARAHADAIEFRMDLANNPLDQLSAYAGDLPIICTNRVKWEGGEAPDDARRIEDLQIAAEHPAVEAVDIELAAVAGGDGLDVIDHARAHGSKVVVSSHDFDHTPPRQELRRLLTTGGDHGDVSKLACRAESLDDTISLLAVTRALDADGHLVSTMAMGAVGRHTRALAPVYGSRIGYAPVDADAATAPGQYDLATLAQLVAQLRSGPESGRAED